MSKCVKCGKEFDVEWHHGHVLLNCDGDFACSQGCVSSWRREMNWIGGTVCASEGNLMAYLNGDLNFEE